MDTKLHFRLTGLGSACEVIEGIQQALQGPCKGTETTVAVITGCEYGYKNKQKHTHSAIYTNLTKATAKERLKKQFGCSKSQYQLSIVTNEESNLSYVTKGQDYTVSSNFEELVMPLDEIKPWVFEVLDFKNQVKELDERYMDSGMDDDAYLDDLLTIYSKSGPKHLMLHQIRSHWLALFNRRNRLSVRRTITPNGYEEAQYYPRQILVEQIKNFIVNKY